MTASIEQPQDAPPAVETTPRSTDEKRIRIRSYRPTDHQGVVDVFVPGLMANAKIPGQSQQFWDDYIGSSLQDDIADIEGTYFAPGGHYWVAVVDTKDGGEEVVGMVAIEHKGEGEGELRRMSVKAEYRRYGVGRMLVDRLEDWAARNGFTRVWLSAGYILEKAHNFYKSLGYKHFTDEVFHEEPLFILAFFEKQLKPLPAH